MVRQERRHLSSLERTLITLLLGGAAGTSVPLWTGKERIAALELQVQDLKLRVVDLSAAVRDLSTRIETLQRMRIAP